MEVFSFLRADKYLFAKIELSYLFTNTKGLATISTLDELAFFNVNFFVKTSLFRLSY